MFVTSVRLFVKSAPFNPDTPVMVDLRPCDATNGNSPSINTVHRFSQVSRTVTDANLTVNTNPDDASGTLFEFSSPVFLPPGRHALTVRCNDSDFALHAGLIGQTSIDKFGNPSQDTVSDVPYTNGLFLASNNGSREPYTDRVLMFDLTRADFVGAEQSLSAREVNFQTEDTESQDGANLVAFRANQQIIASGNDVSVSSVLRFDDFNGGGQVDVTVPVNSDVVLDTRGSIGGASNRGSIFTRLSGNEQKRVSPVLDAERLALLRVEMESNNPTGIGAPAEELDANGESSTVIAKYISKKVVLERPARDFRAYIQADIPSGARMHVFVKAQTPDSIEDFDDLPYIQLFPDGVKDDVAPLPGGSVGDVVDFRNPNIGAENGIDVKFTPAALTETNTDDDGNLATPEDGNLITSLLDNGGEFVAYQVKIVLYAKGGSTEVFRDGLGPVIRRIRCAAIDTPRSVVAPPPPGESEGAVRAINTAKAWGVIEVNSNNTMTIKRAYNVDTVASEGTGKFRIDLTPGIIFAKDADSSGTQNAGDEANMVVLVEPLDIDGAHDRTMGAYARRDAKNTDILSNITVGEKTIQGTGTEAKPSFTLFTQNLLMREYDNNDDGNGRNRVQFVRVNPIARDMTRSDPSDLDEATTAEIGSKGTLCFVVFGSKDSLGVNGSLPGEGTTIIP